MNALLRIAAAVVASLGPIALAADDAPKQPNIVIYLADDMGYGDAGCYNANSKCKTPHIDRLAAGGMRFTDAHAAGAYCIPSRYGLLTGQYPLRCKSLAPNRGPCIEPDQMTVASMLRDRGYTTAMIGKWHLGFDGGNKFDYTKPLAGGPFHRGFDHFFGQHASLDIPPYFYIKNDRVTAAPTGHIEEMNTPGWSPIQGAFWRAGPIAPDFKMDRVLPEYTKRASDYIRSRAKADDGKPFFLYVPITAPHTPWVPTKRFADLPDNMYAQFMAQVDASFGQVLKALDDTGQADNTIVIFSSDNGPVWYPTDVEKYKHASVGPLRGMKADAYEGGHRMPFIVRWPGRIKPGSTSDKLVSFVDVLATLAEVTGKDLPTDAGEDSFSFLGELLGRDAVGPQRDHLLIRRAKGELTVRRGDWKLIPFRGSGGFTKPRKIKPAPGEPRGQLYNLATDLGETKNVYADHPDLVKELTESAARVVEDGRSRPK